MANGIKASEVSEVLLEQLKGIDTTARFQEVGTVLQVSDGVVRIYGLKNAEADELIEFDNGIRAIVMNLEEDNVGAILLGPTDQIKEDMIVHRTGRIASINVSENMVGRVVNPLGQPLDGLQEIEGPFFEMPLERKAPGVVFREPVHQPLLTYSHIYAIDRITCLKVLALVDDGINGYGGLTGLTVTDYKFTLTAANWNHGINGAQTGLKRLMHRLTEHDTGGLALQRHLKERSVQFLESVQGLSQWIDYASQHAFAHID